MANLSRVLLLQQSNMEPPWSRPVRRAAGFIVYRRMPNVEFLLLQASYKTHHWSPPKGHVKPGESDYETALRETFEEAGFTQEMLKIVPDYTIELDYMVENQRKGKTEPKKVVYYLAELMNPKENDVKLSKEHQDFKWLPLKETCKLSGFKDLNEAFEKSLVKIESLSPVDFAT